nr:hypothetical protein [uncultured Cohaesibacter sp.]
MNTDTLQIPEQLFVIREIEADCGGNNHGNFLPSVEGIEKGIRIIGVIAGIVIANVNALAALDTGFRVDADLVIAICDVGGIRAVDRTHSNTLVTPGTFAFIKKNQVVQFGT